MSFVVEKSLSECIRMEKGRKERERIKFTSNHAETFWMMIQEELVAWGVRVGKEENGRVACVRALAREAPAIPG